MDGTFHVAWALKPRGGWFQGHVQPVPEKDGVGSVLHGTALAMPCDLCGGILAALKSPVSEARSPEWRREGVCDI